MSDASILEFLFISYCSLDGTSGILDIVDVNCAAAICLIGGTATSKVVEVDWVIAPIGKGADTGADDADKEADTGAVDVDKGTDTGAVDVGKGVDTGADDAGKGADTGAVDVGKGVDTGADDAGKGADTDWVGFVLIINMTYIFYL